MIFKLAYIPVIILAFFYPFISVGLLLLGVFFLVYIYYASLKKTKKEVGYFKNEIELYFENVIGDGEYHFNYIRNNSLYFLKPAASKLFRKVLANTSITIILIAVIYFFRFYEARLWFSIFCVISAILIYNFSLNFAKPATEYQIRNTSTFSDKQRMGLEEYPEFFYHGEYARIKKEGNDKWMSDAKALLNLFRDQ
ncbi:MAG TPA: hypothetical protein VLZ83_12700 [Edaphocola sp.]|nr:hypothetical protein [Edaphocola sp.]